MISKNARIVALTFCFIFSCFFIPLSAQNLIPDSVQLTWCDRYNKHRSWLPEPYFSNALCACYHLPTDSAALTIRQSLLYALDTTSETFKTAATQLKSDCISGKISKKQYWRFVKKEIVPRVYAHHVAAYRLAGCPEGPSPFWEWKVSCKHQFKNCRRMLRLNLKNGGSCNRKNGTW